MVGEPAGTRGGRGRSGVGPSRGHPTGSSTRARLADRAVGALGGRRGRLDGCRRRPHRGPGHHDFHVHMLGHTLLGMLGPLVLVLAAPATRALRAPPVQHARRMSAVLRRPLVAVATHPVVAVRRGDRRSGPGAASARPACAGRGAGPGPRRAQRPAKTIYAFPPPGVDPAPTAELVMIIVLCREWARIGYAPARRTGRGLAGGTSWHSDDGRAALPIDRSPSGSRQEKRRVDHDNRRRGGRRRSPRSGRGGRPRGCRVGRLRAGVHRHDRWCDQIH
ncbi:MAG TPA: cytochrome c oxidase assembly protein [Pseudonocardia sp.]|nr:cytochrome c oxidase assembly protein [Pseudonocardia sp.]